jgi:glycosyltransferase involved in cell wall biosynthesis
MRNSEAACHTFRDTEQGGRRGSARRIKVLHVINSFEYGGAEAMLCTLLLRCDRERFEPSVVALIDDLTVAGPVLRAGIPVATMGMKPGVPDPRGIARLARHLRRAKPAVIQCWMDHSNLIGGLAARLASRAPVVWGVHHSDHLAGVTKRSTLLTVSACAALSHRVPARVVCCSEHGRSLYRRMGFANRKLSVIPNGFDVDAFRPDPAARAAIRQEIGVGPDTPLLGLVARYDPLKDHSTFLRAAALLARKWNDVHFLLCGTKVNQANAVLFPQVESLGLAGRCHLLGPRRDVARVYAALDIATSSSLSEAFPLAIGEAMACGVPCVATDVGDCALMLGATGRIVPPADPAALAAAWGEIFSMTPPDRQKLGLTARQRVRERFDIGAVTRRYEDLYERLATHRASAASGRRIARKRELPATPRGSVSSSPGGIAYVHTGYAVS